MFISLRFDPMVKYSIFKVSLYFVYLIIKSILALLFLARNAEERQIWISNLEDAISLNTVNTLVFLLHWIFIPKMLFSFIQNDLSYSNTTLFQRKITEVDAYLQLLIDYTNVSIIF